jgi:O-antigen biosynthesis protein WbqP
MYSRIFKRPLDIAVAVIALLAFMPVIVLVSIWIAVSDPGPILFKQNRVGRNGCLFTFYKFRSLPVDTGDIASDQLPELRLKTVGRFIRRSNFDELPQLFNVIKGDMSIIGPRPPILAQVELIELRRQNGALSCRPGLTGLAQVNAFDGMSFQEKADYDGRYAVSVGFITDLAILARTVLYLLRPPPKY